ncbi:hypothetical protein ACCS79_03495 [Rhizobium johnstonii]|uniref:hypothetical protein n=1 Tax=Rhizobium johnstonii TaxID=3019933 RepID=UPI003F9E0828
MSDLMSPRIREAVAIVRRYAAAIPEMRALFNLNELAPELRDTLANISDADLRALRLGGTAAALRFVQGRSPYLSERDQLVHAVRARMQPRGQFAMPTLKPYPFDV